LFKYALMWMWHEVLLPVSSQYTNIYILAVEEIIYMPVILQNVWVTNSQETKCIKEFAVWWYTKWYVHIFTVTERVACHWL